MAKAYGIPLTPPRDTVLVVSDAPALQAAAPTPQGPDQQGTPTGIATACNGAAVEVPEPQQAQPAAASDAMEDGTPAGGDASAGALGTSGSSGTDSDDEGEEEADEGVKGGGEGGFGGEESESAAEGQAQLAGSRRATSAGETSRNTCAVCFVSRGTAACRRKPTLCLLTLAACTSNLSTLCLRLAASYCPIGLSIFICQQVLVILLYIMHLHSLPATVLQGRPAAATSA